MAVNENSADRASLRGQGKEAQTKHGSLKAVVKLKTFHLGLILLLFDCKSSRKGLAFK